MLRQTLACITILFSTCFSPLALAHTWQALAPGIEYIDLGQTVLTRWSHIHVFRIDLKNNALGIVMAKHLSQRQASANDFAHYSNALITLNGGFFDRKFHSLGLRINQHEQYNPIKRISWWGIFYIEGEKAHISSPKQFHDTKHIDFAMQSGPRLLIDGEVPSLKPGLDERSALGITEKGEVIILVTDNAPLTTTNLANIMKKPPLNCVDALNLDGGGSSQISAHIGFFKLNVHGFSNVSDAIVVKPRK